MVKEVYISYHISLGSVEVTTCVPTNPWKVTDTFILYTHLEKHKKQDDDAIQNRIMNLYKTFITKS